MSMLEEAIGMTVPYTREDIELWVEEIEDFIAAQVDGITPPGYPPVKWEFLRGSTQIQDIVPDQTEDSLYLGYLRVGYTLRWRGVCTGKSGVQLSIRYAQGTAEVPITNTYRLCLCEFDPFENLYREERNG